MRSAAGTARLFVRDPMAGFQVPVLTRKKKGPHSGLRLLTKKGQQPFLLNSE
jgi:hypothetical protein